MCLPLSYLLYVHTISTYVIFVAVIAWQAGAGCLPQALRSAGQEAEGPAAASPPQGPPTSAPLPERRLGTLGWSGRSPVCPRVRSIPAITVTLRTAAPKELPVTAFLSLLLGIAILLQIC